MRVLSFSIAIPKDGIAHAGGEYYLRHVRALAAEGHQVTIVAPRIKENTEAAEVPGLPADVLLLSNRDRWTTPFSELLERVRPARGSRVFFRRARRSDRVAALVADADLIEFQWTQTGDVQRVLRAGGVPSVLVAHDVMSQSLGRAAAQPDVRPLRRLLRRLKYRLTLTDERTVLRGKTAVVVFSRKDRDLIEQLVPSVRVEVVEPSLEPRAEDWAANVPATAPTVLFVGAFDRDENATGAEWLLSEVWPSVAEARPDARLVLAGGAPTPGMVARAGAAHNVSVTGYVADLDEVYRTASVVVVPLLKGAGVKFKTVTAMMWGLPIVSTPVGVEGIAEDGEDVFAAVTDEPHRFASAVVRALDPDGEDVERGRRARELARNHYGDRGFRRRLDGLYRELRCSMSARTSSPAGGARG